jgi:hypothetical protein
LKNYILLAFGLILVVACSNTTNVELSLTPVSTSGATAMKVPTQTLFTSSALSPSTAPTETLSPVSWVSAPVVPRGVTTRMIDVFKQGLERGQNITPYFLSAFDDPLKFRLGNQYSNLQATVELFKGSWSRASYATHGGYNAATVLSSFWTLVPRPNLCNKGETPAACEIRIYNPSFAVISMEEEWSGDLQKYDHYMRLLVEFVLSQDVVPIIGTRAEPPNSLVSINNIITQISYDYGIPLWNFGAATLDLPNYGLSSDGFHLTPGTVEGNYYFDDPGRMKLGWTWRNLTALQTIDAVSQFLRLTK